MIFFQLHGLYPSKMECINISVPLIENNFLQLPNSAGGKNSYCRHFNALP